MSLQITLIGIGILLIILSFWAHAFKVLLINYAVGWSGLGLCLILIGFFSKNLKWMDYFEIVILGMILLFLFEMFHESLIVSKINTKINELGVQVAILNLENETLKIKLKRLSTVEERDNEDKKNSFCH